MADQPSLTPVSDATAEMLAEMRVRLAARLADAGPDGVRVRIGTALIEAGAIASGRELDGGAEEADIMLGLAGGIANVIASAVGRAYQDHAQAERIRQILAEAQKQALSIAATSLNRRNHRRVRSGSAQRGRH